MFAPYWPDGLDSWDRTRRLHSSRRSVTSRPAEGVEPYRNRLVDPDGRQAIISGDGKWNEPKKNSWSPT